MTDYKTLYFTLFNKVTDLIEELKEIQCQMEEMYVSSDLIDMIESNEDLKNYKNILPHMTFNLLQTTPPACSHLPYAKHRGGLFVLPLTCNP